MRNEGSHDGVALLSDKEARKYQALEILCSLVGGISAGSLVVDNVAMDNEIMNVADKDGWVIRGLTGKSSIEVTYHAIKEEEGDES